MHFHKLTIKLLQNFNFFSDKMSATTAATPDLTASSSIWSATSVFYLLLLPAVVLWYAYWKISRRHLMELADKIPGPPGYPLLGSALEFVGSSAGKMFHKISTWKLYFELHVKSFESFLIKFTYCLKKLFLLYLSPN